MTIGARTYLKSHKMSGRQLLFNLSQEGDALLKRAKETRTGRTAKTLVKEGALRMTLVALRQGAAMAKHHVDGQTTIQVLRGSLTVQTNQGATRLSKGHVLVLNEDVEHAALAPADCSFLITMSWRGEI